MGRKSTQQADMKIETLFAVLMILVVGIGGLLLWRINLLEQRSVPAGNTNTAAVPGPGNAPEGSDSQALPPAAVNASDGVIEAVSEGSLTLKTITGSEQRFTLSSAAKVFVRTPSTNINATQSVTEKAASVKDIKPGQNAIVEFSVLNNIFTATKIIIIAI
jgi:hypothetical protein